MILGVNGPGLNRLQRGAHPLLAPIAAPAYPLKIDLTQCTSELNACQTRDVQERFVAQELTLDMRSYTRHGFNCQL
jgi:hypothetical protein